MTYLKLVDSWDIDRAYQDTNGTCDPPKIEFSSTKAGLHFHSPRGPLDIVFAPLGYRGKLEPTNEGRALELALELYGKRGESRMPLPVREWIHHHAAARAAIISCEKIARRHKKVLAVQAHNFTTQATLTSLMKDSGLLSVSSGLWVLGSTIADGKEYDNIQTYGF